MKHSSAYPGTAGLDASIALAIRFGFEGAERRARTLDAIDCELGAAGSHYRYSGTETEEGCFLACTFWMIEARAISGQRQQAAWARAGRSRFGALWRAQGDPSAGWLTACRAQFGPNPRRPGKGGFRLALLKASRSDRRSGRFRP